MNRLHHESKIIIKKTTNSQIKRECSNFGYANVRALNISDGGDCFDTSERKLVSWLLQRPSPVPTRLNLQIELGLVL